MLLIPVMFRFMLSQRISCFDNLSTQTTGNRNPSDMIGLNVVHYMLKFSLLSTDLANPCPYSAFLIGINIFAHRHH